MKDEQVRELLYQMLETEMGGVQVYTHAIQCAENEDLKEEWEEYLEQTKKHVEVVQQCMQTLDWIPMKKHRDGRWCDTSANRWWKRWRWR